MAIEAKRKRGETFEAFLRRFNKRIIQGKMILQYKEKMYERKKLNKNLRRKLALSRKEYRERYERLKKAGRLPEEKVKKPRRG